MIEADESPLRIGEQSVPMHIVLVEPEIPPNTGNIARLCAATGAWLHLVEPLGFTLDDKKLKRAGLDYWPAVRLTVHASFSELASRLVRERCHFFSKRAKQLYTSVDYRPGCVLIFGKETTGLPEPYRVHLGWTAETALIPWAVPKPRVARLVPEMSVTPAGRRPDGDRVARETCPPASGAPGSRDDSR